MTGSRIVAILCLACLLGLFLLPSPEAPLPANKPAPLPKGRTVVVFTTPGCGPCAALKSELEKPAAREALQKGNWKLDLTTGTDPRSQRRCRVRSFPTTIALDDQKELGRKTGAMTAEEFALWLASFDSREAPEAKVAGPVAPDGKTEIHCDLPGELHRENTASKGLGNCVFTSIHHAAVWQNVPAVQEFPQWLIDKGIPGGGYPSKVAKLVPEISRDRGLPVPDYIQVEGPDLEILKLACSTGRMPSVTYSVSPTGRYRGRRIAHMVNLVHADDNWFCVLDNNYIGYDQFEWMSPEEFKRPYGSGWAVILLAPPPPPVPHNGSQEEANVYLPHPMAFMAALSALLAPLDAYGGWGSGCGPVGPAVPFAPARPLQYVWKRTKSGQFALYRGNRQCGVYNPATGNYRSVRDGTLGEPCEAPVKLPAAARPLVGPPAPEGVRGPANYGVETDKLHCPDSPVYRINGRVVSREEAYKAVEGQVPDDRNKPCLTVIGSEDQRRRVLTDLQGPDLQPIAEKARVQSYPPNHWYVQRVGMVTTGKPTIYYQAADGTVLHRQDDYDGPASLAGAIRKADPNYRPDQDRDRRKADPVLPGPFGAIPVPLVVLGGVVLLGFALRK